MRVGAARLPLPDCPSGPQQTAFILFQSFRCQSPGATTSAQGSYGDSRAARCFAAMEGRSNQDHPGTLLAGRGGVPGGAPCCGRDSGKSLLLLPSQEIRFWIHPSLRTRPMTIGSLRFTCFEDTLIWGEPSVFRQAKAPDALPPPPPGNVWVIPVKGALEMHWLKSEGKVEGYHVYRREGKEIIRLDGNTAEQSTLCRSFRQEECYLLLCRIRRGQPDR